MAKVIANTYGDALFDLCRETDSLDIVEAEIKTVKEALKENPDLFKFLNSPKIRKEEKISMIEKVFQGRTQDHVTGFLVIIVEKDRYNEIDNIFDYFLAKVREYKNIGVALVTSAMELNEEQKTKIEQKLLATTKYESIQIQYEVDKKLLGGLVIRIGDRVVDSSLQSRLRNLSKQLRNIQMSEA